MRETEERRYLEQVSILESVIEQLRRLQTI
jgi:hypothetical protein